MEQQCSGDTELSGSGLTFNSSNIRWPVQLIDDSENSVNFIPRESVGYKNPMLSSIAPSERSSPVLQQQPLLDEDLFQSPDTHRHLQDRASLPFKVTSAVGNLLQQVPGDSSFDPISPPLLQERLSRRYETDNIWNHVPPPIMPDALMKIINHEGISCDKMQQIGNDSVQLWADIHFSKMMTSLQYDLNEFIEGMKSEAFNAGRVASRSNFIEAGR